MLTPESSVLQLSGVGKARAAQLERLGISTLKDLIYCFPKSYEDRGNIIPLSLIDEYNAHAYVLTVASEVKTAKIRQNLSISKFRAFDDSASCEVVFFNAPYVKDVFHIGATFRFFGKISIVKGKIQFSNPKYEPYIEGEPLSRFFPVYPLTEGLSGKIMDKLIEKALSAISEQIKDPLPETIRLDNSLPTLTYALKNIHNPESEEALKKAIKRLAFDEMLYFGIGVSLSRQYKNSFSGVRFSPCDMKEFTEKLPYELTDSQKSVINDIYSDTVIKTKTESNSHMARIVVGDVGSGKTVCAEAAIFLAVKSGFQAVLMAPTEILARQHYIEISELFDKMGFKTELLVGACGAKEKRRIYEAMKSGEGNIFIGTHALLSENTSFKNLGLVITDEQHRFGVAQRAVLNDKNKSAHMLVMSATPIPRTLALAMYGDLDVSRITELPKGRQTVDTFVIDESYRDRLNGFIEKQISLGGQCYVVCPAIEGEDEIVKNDFLNDKPKMKNVLDFTVKLRQIFENYRIEALHGKTNAKEKDEIMQGFSKGEIQILVATTIIEVGVNVPNATLMIIEAADRYGLSQLHQLRGRVGRGNRKSYCVLVSDSSAQKARERLEIMKNSHDGFEIANRDLEMRGPGDFFASKNSESFRQSGGFEFKLANLSNDSDLVKAAFSTAKDIVAKDPTLSLPYHRAISEEIQKFIAPISSTIS